MKKSVYRHFGSSKFDRELFNPIHNRPFSNKPFGGLWACPVEDKDIDWEEWCRREEFNLESLEEHFDFTIKDDSKIMVIKDIKDLDKLPRVKNPEFILEYDIMNSNIDFEELAKEYDGIMVWIYRSSDIDLTRMSFDGIYYRMYGWDVDTLVVFNPDIIEEC